MECAMTYRQNPRDDQTPQSGKSDNDRNKLGGKSETQLNQGHRTPSSRHDRESQIGSSNQSQSRSHKR
jgi:hypothetical protein